MFYIGDVLWLEEKDSVYDIPGGFFNFSGIIRELHSTIPWINNSSSWYKNGKRHRDKNSPGGEGPAIIWGDGVAEWYYEDASYASDEGRKPQNFPE